MILNVPHIANLSLVSHYTSIINTFISRIETQSLEYRFYCRDVWWRRSTDSLIRIIEFSYRCLFPSVFKSTSMKQSKNIVREQNTSQRKFYWIKTKKSEHSCKCLKLSSQIWYMRDTMGLKTKTKPPVLQ